MQTCGIACSFPSTLGGCWPTNTSFDPTVNQPLTGFGGGNVRCNSAIPDWCVQAGALYLHGGRGWAAAMLPVYQGCPALL